MSYDRRGYANSLELPVASGFDRHVADLAHVVGQEPAVIVGHSFGGLVALGFAAEFGSLTQAVLAYEAPLSWLRWWRSGHTPKPGSSPSSAEVAERFFRRVVGDSAWKRLSASARELRRNEGAALVADLASVTHGAPFDAVDIMSPVLIARGENTLDRHIRGASELAEMLGERKPTIVAGASHGAHLTHPDSFARLVEDTVSLTARP